MPTILLFGLSVIAFVLIAESLLKARNYAYNQHNIIFMGAPGAGKGTQAVRLAKVLDVPHLSSGDLLRQAVAEGTPIGQELKSYIEKGQLAPDEVLNAMIAEELAKDKYDRGFILDGFPRTLQQAEFLDDYLDERKRYITAVFDLHVDEDLLVERITGRRICSNALCAAVYHLTSMPPRVADICDKCGRPLAQRADDTEVVLRERITRHDQRTVPLLIHYDNHGTLFNIDGSGKIEEISEEILLSLGL